MLVPLSWLKDFVTIDRPVAEVDRILTNAGLEVKTIEFIGIPGANLEWDRDLMEQARDAKSAAALLQIPPIPSPTDPSICCRDRASASSMLCRCCW